jgi:hypothetical protein
MSKLDKWLATLLVDYNSPSLHFYTFIQKVVDPGSQIGLIQPQAAVRSGGGFRTILGEMAWMRPCYWIWIWSTYSWVSRFGRWLPLSAALTPAPKISSDCADLFHHFFWYARDLEHQISHMPSSTNHEYLVSWMLRVNAVETCTPFCLTHLIFVTMAG